MKIQINHIAKIEGHASFLAHVLKGDVKSAKIETQEGARLIEGILVGRKMQDAPIIAARICGICPVVHNLTAIRAIENALGIKQSQSVKDLRKLMQYGQVIHSHGLHLFFLSLPDFLGIENDIKLVEKYKAETKLAIKIRDFGIDIAKIIGGRTVHPITSEIGGFKKFPTKKQFLGLLQNYDQLLQGAVSLGKVFRDLKYPDFQRETEFISLAHKNEYAIYEGDIKSNKGLKIPVSKFANEVTEIEHATQAAKRVEHQGHEYMVGALARINNNYAKLNPEAKKLWQSAKIKLPDYNTFHNIFAQSVEVVHCIEESKKLIDKLLKVNFKAIKTKLPKKSGFGVAAMEAPRGTLYHAYEINKDGIIKSCNIIPPTTQFLHNLEEDLKEYLPDLKKMKMAEKKRKIRALIRAYDPCIACSVH